MRTRTLFAALLCLVSSAQAQIPEFESPRELHSLPRAPLVHLNDSVLTVGQLGDYLYNLGVHPTGQRQRDLDTLKASLDWFIDEAIICGHLDTAAILSQPKAMRRARWRMAHRAGPLTYTYLVEPRVSVPQAEVDQFYKDSIQSLFTAPSKREVRHLLISPEDEVTPEGKRIRSRAHTAAARALADSLKSAVLAGASFDSLAGAFSDDTSSSGQKGYLGWLFPGNTVYDFDTAAFAANVGEIRGPVKTLYGFHLIRVEQIRPESTIAYTDSMGMLIRKQLEFTQGKKLGTLWADSVIQATHWGYNDPALAQVPGLDSSVWLVTLNDRDTMWSEDWIGAWELYRRNHDIEGPGTLDDKHASLRGSSFPYLYLQVAEDKGFADDSVIVAEYRQFLRSEALRISKERLYSLQEPPADLIDPTKGLELEPEPDKKLHVLSIRSCDTATIWEAYRKLSTGDDFKSVARRYHDNVRESGPGGWDLGWVASTDLPAELWGRAWILEIGNFTRPAEYDSCYYILQLADRFQQPVPQERRQAQIDSIRAEYGRAGLEQWRSEVRDGHRIRFDRSVWNRVQQLWRP